MSVIIPTDEPAEPTSVVIAIRKPEPETHIVNFLYIDHEWMEMRILLTEWLNLKENKDLVQWNAIRKQATNPEDPYFWMQNQAKRAIN